MITFVIHNLIKSIDFDFNRFISARSSKGWYQNGRGSSLIFLYTL